MRRTSFILIIALLISSVAYGSLNDSIGNHWSKTTIEESFIRGYFPYLADGDFANFNPDGPMLVREFSTSLSLLLKGYKYEVKAIEDNSLISREKMVELLAGELNSIRGSGDENIILPFKDIYNMDEKNKALLGSLYKLQIIKGDSNAQFSPKRILSQAEAIITLQRAREILTSLDTGDMVPFKTLGLVQTFTGKEEIVVIPQGDKVIVTIAKEFPTPGYGMEINNILRTKDGYKISFNIQGPPSDSIQLQVITYKTISLEIDKSELGDMPYNFILEGYNIIG